MAGEVLEGVSPTRMELLQIRKRRALAVKGHQLLSEKRDALVTQFFDLLKKRKDARREMERALREAFRALVLAEMTLGERQTRQLAEKLTGERDITVEKENIMGVAIPHFQAERATTPPYSLMSTNASFDKAISQAQDAFNHIIEVATIEGSVQMLGREIEKTKRRVNALEYIFIPRLVTTIGYIERQLEEREREDFFRRKRIKALLEHHED
jgi:V/A-type H+-transporting ATPase subunit D